MHHDTWLDTTQLTTPEHGVTDSTFRRLWGGFLSARVMVALVLVLLQAGQSMLSSGGHVAALSLCGVYLVTTIGTLIQVRLQPSALQTTEHSAQHFTHHWQLTIAVDMLAFAALQWIDAGTINYAPLLGLPVLLASIMGSATVALAAAAAVTLYLLGLAWQASVKSLMDTTPAFFQAGLTGIGYFGVAILANQLANRLIRQEQLAQSSQHAIALQTQVNELVIDTLSHGVIVIDEEGKVRAANPAARLLMGAAQQSLQVPFALNAALAWQPLLDVTRTTFFKHTGQTLDVVIQHPGEVARRVNVRTQLTSDTGVLLQPARERVCVAFIENIPEIEARLRHEKMVAMGRMSAAVAHEIRNPLAAITQANALLAEDLQDPAQQRLTHMIAQNAKRLDRIVDDVLNVARVPRHSVDDTPRLPLDATVQRLSLDWIQQNRMQATTVLSLNAANLSLAFDEEHLRRILVNLLDNAARYCSLHPRAIVVATTANLAKTKGQLCVWSDGTALDPAVQRHLFEPFFSSESRSSGLGLFLCRELCDRHGATLNYARQVSPLHTVEDHQDAPVAAPLGNGFSLDFSLHSSLHSSLNSSLNSSLYPPAPPEGQP